MPRRSPKRNNADHAKSAAVTTTRNSSATKSCARWNGGGGFRVRVYRRGPRAARLGSRFAGIRLASARFARSLAHFVVSARHAQRVVYESREWVSARASNHLRAERVRSVHGRDDGEGDERGRRLARAKKHREPRDAGFPPGRDGEETRAALAEVQGSNPARFLARARRARGGVRWGGVGGRGGGARGVRMRVAKLLERRVVRGFRVDVGGRRRGGSRGARRRGEVSGGFAVAVEGSLARTRGRVGMGRRRRRARVARRRPPPRGGRVVHVETRVSLRRASLGVALGVALQTAHLVAHRPRRVAGRGGGRHARAFRARVPRATSAVVTRTPRETPETRSGSGQPRTTGRYVSRRAPRLFVVPED